VVRVVIRLPSHVWPRDYTVLLRGVSGAASIYCQVGPYLQQGLQMADVSDSQSVEKNESNSTMKWWPYLM
jgi:hypothetical protein